MISNKVLNKLGIARGSILGRLMSTIISVILHCVLFILFPIAKFFESPKYPNLKRDYYSNSKIATTGLTISDDLEDSQTIISLIIPMYNVQDTVAKCLESVVENVVQFDSEVEVLLINDGSTDNTRKIAADFVSQFPVLKLIDKVNGGLSSARNEGLRRARGKYVYFLDSDDRLKPNACERWLFDIQKNPELVQYSFQVVSGNVSHDTVFKDALYDKTTQIPRVWSGFPWGKLIKTDLFEAGFFPEGYWFEDSIFPFLIFPLVKSYQLSSFLSQEYMINPNGITLKSKGNVRSLDHVYLTKEYVKLWEKRKFRPDASMIEFLFSQLSNHMFGRIHDLCQEDQIFAFNTAAALVEKLNPVKMDDRLLSWAFRYRKFTYWKLISLIHD